MYTLSEQATNHFEACREKVQHFIHAPSFSEIIFVLGNSSRVKRVR
nr:aminotransferase class V-fold PLP-dependent enzyme [Rickettsiella massiliensis]